MSAVAIIPARGGSRRIKKKNIRQFFGKPIIAYSIEAAQKSGLFDQIIVSTDDEEISEIAEALGVDVLDRQPALASDGVGTQEVMHEELRRVKPRPDYACCIYATAPLMHIKDLRRGYREVAEEFKRTFSFSVGESPLCDAGQFYWGRTTAFLKLLPLIAPHTAMIPINKERVCDINTEEDWLKAEQMYLALHPEMNK